MQKATGIPIIDISHIKEKIRLYFSGNDEAKFIHCLHAIVVAVMALLTALTSCDKNDNHVHDYTSCYKNDNHVHVYVGVKLLDTETRGLYHSRKFIYDNQNRMKEIWTYSGGKLYEKAIITYTDEDLTKLEYAYLDEEGEFVVVSTRNYVKKDNTISYSMGVEIIEGEGEGEVDGNLTKYLYDTAFSSLLNDPGEKYYTYGAERSVFSGCNTPKWFMFLHYREMASHNVVKSSSFPNGTSYSSYSYEFDSDGFPTKIFHSTGDITEYKYQIIM